MRPSKSGTRKMSAMALSCTLLLLISACHKKVPVAVAPPPPPAAPAPTPAPPPPTPAKPSINSFTAEPGSIQRGQSATLRWSVSNATDISIDQGVGAVPSTGNRQAFPTSSTTYTLSARGPGGADSRTATVAVTIPLPPAPPPKITRTPSPAEILTSEVRDAYFDFDKSNIRGDAQQTLRNDAAVLKQIFQGNPGFTVMVEGNCDERGSAEYNLALGDRRGTSAKDFLVQLGVPADRLKTISYGKDRPVCTEQTEECYQRNRHVHFTPAQ
jgi:peptidoglycan-associated lipoprotein